MQNRKGQSFGFYFVACGVCVDRQGSVSLDFSSSARVFYFREGGIILKIAIHKKSTFLATFALSSLKSRILNNLT